MATMPEPVRDAVQRLMVDYCYAVDASESAEDVVQHFAPDAVIDFSSVGFPTMAGEAEIRAFYGGLVENMAHEFHMASNFRPVSWDGATAIAEAYVIGMGQPKQGDGILVHVKYRMECRDSGQGWKCHRFSLVPMMPL